MPREPAHGAVELVLEHGREEVTRVGHVGGDVILGAGIEVLLSAGLGRGHALILRAQLPPGLVVLLGRDLAGEHLPTPLVDHLTERQEGHLLQRVLHQLVQRPLVVVRDHLEQPHLLQVRGRDRERDGIADRLMKAVVGSILKQDRERMILGEVVVVPELVMDGDQIVHVDLDAHLDAQVAVVVHVPGARVADHLAPRWLLEHRALPEGLGQLRQPERREERLAQLHHADLVVLLLDQRGRDVELPLAREGLEVPVQIAPLLRPHVAE